LARTVSRSARLAERHERLQVGHEPGARTLASVRVEYADGGQEVDDLALDPYELRNGYSPRSGEQKTLLRRTLEAVKNCHDAKRFAAAERPGRTVTRKWNRGRNRRRAWSCAPRLLCDRGNRPNRCCVCAIAARQVPQFAASPDATGCT